MINPDVLTFSYFGDDYFKIFDIWCLCIVIIETICWGFIVIPAMRVTALFRPFPGGANVTGVTKRG